ncbi:hypothetical protein RJI07_02680 [Mycoplasmatota bacterium WC30]
MTEYTFIDFKKDIIISCLESVFEYNGKEYDLSIVPGRYRLFNKRKYSPDWRLFNNTDKIEVIRCKRETILDEIIIEGKKLEDIWSKITII